MNANHLTLPIALSIALLPAVASAIDGDKAAYVGGTFAPYAGAKDVEGPLDTDHPEAITLTPKKTVQLRIPYSKVIDLEYGQKAGRRVGLAVGLAVINPVGLTALFSKKRNHYLTIGYLGDDGTEHVVVLELGKNLVRSTLAIVETRSGKPLQYQDEEARKASR